MSQRGHIVQLFLGSFTLSHGCMLCAIIQACCVWPHVTVGRFAAARAPWTSVASLAPMFGHGVAGSAESRLSKRDRQACTMYFTLPRDWTCSLLLYVLQCAAADARFGIALEHSAHARHESSLEGFISHHQLLTHFRVCLISIKGLVESYPDHRHHCVP
jgi:hypothetical protein